jgi:hypothetical protein
MNSGPELARLTRSISNYMGRRVTIFIAAFFALSSLTTVLEGQKPSVYRIDRLSFNSSVFNEISPVITRDGLIFCSDKRFSIIKDRTSFDGRRLYNLYLTAKEDTTSWKKPVEMKGERSTLFNNGPFCISPGDTAIYFTSEIETGNAAKKKNFRNHSGIFIAGISGQNLVSMRSFKYNSANYDIGQPSLSADGRYLYFASNMPGGAGGSDLWYCELVNGEWSAPVNFGPSVNTNASESFPYIHPSGRLYFTSDRPGGVGRMDIYYTSQNSGKWDEPVLLPEPLNSPADDFGIVADPDLQKGYFTSDRMNTDDIYSFVSTIIRKDKCDSMEENSYCFRFVEENSSKLDSIPFRYDWRFGDGQKASGVMVEHCYEKPGTYIVQLDVLNLVTNELSVNEKSDTLVVTQIEQAYFAAPDTIQSGQSIVLDANETNLPTWNIDRFYWNFDDETVATGTKVNKTFLKPGVYNVQLIVSDRPQPGRFVREACVSKNINVVNK